MSDPMLRPLFNTHAQIACIGELQTREVKHLQRIAVLEKALRSSLCPYPMQPLGLTGEHSVDWCVSHGSCGCDNRAALAGTGKDDK